MDVTDFAVFSEDHCVGRTLSECPLVLSLGKF